MVEIFKIVMPCIQYHRLALLLGMFVPLVLFLKLYDFLKGI